MEISRLCLSCMNDNRGMTTCPICGYRAGNTDELSYFLSPGTILNGKYLVGKVLGHGGFGVTYLAYDLNLGMKVAIKEFMPEGLVTRMPGDTYLSVYSGEKRENFEYGVEKFLEEARTMNRFSADSNIVNVLNSFKENGTAYYVMEYISGMDLKKYLDKNGGKISIEETLRIVFYVCDALEAVHGKGYIHRDVSPDNIYVADNGSVKLMDFGAARHAIGERSKNFSVILKPGYAPEEQYRSKGEQGPWTDIYALGATMYRMLTGSVPPQSLDRLEQDSLSRPSRMGVRISLSVENALLKAMSVNSKDRFQNIREFSDALRGITSLRVNHSQKRPMPEGSPQFIAPKSNNQNYNMMSNANMGEGSGCIVNYAGFGERVLAYIIDVFVVSLGYGIVYGILASGGIYSYDFFTILRIAYMVTGWLYFALMESSKRQATLGKIAMGIKVVDYQYGRISFGKATGRYFGKILSGMIAAVGYLMAAFTDRKQGLHDLIAGTLVVKVSAVPQAYGSGNMFAPQPVMQVGKPSIYGVAGIYTNSMFPVNEMGLLIGRDNMSCQIVYPGDSPGISGRHCRVTYNQRDNMIYLSDMGSSYGTFLENGTRLIQGQVYGLRPGERFYLASKNNMFEVRS